MPTPILSIRKGRKPAWGQGRKQIADLRRKNLRPWPRDLRDHVQNTRGEDPRLAEQVQEAEETRRRGIARRGPW